MFLNLANSMTMFTKNVTVIKQKFVKSIYFTWDDFFLTATHVCIQMKSFSF